ncbi:MAG: GNAT family N-acetyltransferase [Erysipelotrichaceae bacterium]
MIRRATLEDVTTIVAMIEEAKAFLKSNGVPQWQADYPNAQTVRQDILAHQSYVWEEAGEVVGSMMLSFEKEVTYDVVYQGAWRQEGPYAVIHRLVVADCAKGKGVSGKLFAAAKALSLDHEVHMIRIDTHEVNHAMQRTLQKNGFVCIGTIHLIDHEPRLAFDWLF